MADDTRERVLQAAGRIFARYGFEGATVRDICAEADVNVASVNYHFGSKETLYLETVKLAHHQKSSRVPLPELPRGATREQKLQGFIRTMLQRLLGEGDDGWQTELLIREMFQPTHACKPLVEDYIRPHFHLLLNIINEFVDSSTEESERHQLAFNIVGQCLHHRVAAGFVSLLLDPDEHAALIDLDQLTDRISRFSVAALSHWSETPAEATQSGPERCRNRARRQRRHSRNTP